MATFGSLLRHYRLRAGLGLRTCAALLEERASTVSAIESGRRAPWRRDRVLGRVAEVLGLVENSQLWQKMLATAKTGSTNCLETSGSLVWWWTTEDCPTLKNETVQQLANFVGATFEYKDRHPQTDSPLTELAIEWRVRQLLGQRSTQIATAPVDIEAVLENEANIRIEILPGLIPRYSVQACVVRSAGQTTLLVDRIVADSRPMAAYRLLLAQNYAPAALGCPLDEMHDASWFLDQQADEKWASTAHDCERFALSMLLPAKPVLNGAECAYRELVEQQGWVEIDIATRWVRNRLAEQFAVPPALVQRRLLGWPCHLYGRIAQALAAEESALPPLDWLPEDVPTRQRMLFEKRVPIGA
ncbi:MAG: helix-turn-helix domain-containing protein [Pirellulales bacterium]|nr:helix-turn-helix domain-containing protein [Pirellulales bacterium]